MFCTALGKVEDVRGVSWHGVDEDIRTCRMFRVHGLSPFPYDAAFAFR